MTGCQSPKARFFLRTLTGYSTTRQCLPEQLTPKEGPVRLVLRYWSGGLGVRNTRTLSDPRWPAVIAWSNRSMLKFIGAR